MSLLGAGDDALPDPRLADGGKRVGGGVPVVEVADDADVGRVRRPDGEADAVVDDVRAELLVQLLVPAGAALEKLLTVFELEKAVYELRYELNNRPDWVKIPVAGILRMLETEVAA
jgi:predicted trehalose synthase